MANEELYQALKNADAAGDVEGALKIAAYIQSQNAAPVQAPSKPLPIGKEGFADTLKQELAYHPIAAKFAAAGTALSDLYQGTKQAFGAGDKEAIANNNIIKDANPGSAILGNVALYAGTGMLNPVLNTVKGATIAGGVAGALSPTMDDNVVYGKAKNALLGAATSFAGAKGGQYIGDKIDAKKAAELLRQSKNATRDATIAQAREAGYVIPPSTTNPSWLNRSLESLAGKDATKHAASFQNQEVTNSLARKALGLDDSVSLSDDVLRGIRKEAGKSYADVAALDSTAPNVLEELKNSRFQANAYMKFYGRSGDPKALAEANMHKEAADKLESALEQAATFYNKPELLDALKASRKQIAKSYTVDRALNDATGNVNAKLIGKAFEKDAPLTGELETIGKFASAFPQASRLADDIGSPGVSKLKFALASILGTGGAVGGGPVGAAAGALPFVAPDLAKSLILSKGYQSLMANPKYGIGPTNKLAKALLASRYSPMAITGATVPALSE